MAFDIFGGERTTSFTRDITGVKRVTRTKSAGASGIMGILAPGVLLFLGYLFIAGTVGFSSQLQILLIIAGGAWLILKK